MEQKPQKPPNPANPANPATPASPGGSPPTEDQLRARLTADEFRITREKGTEPAFTGRYWNTKTAGTYHCVCCGEPLFDSDAKFDSGSGWPSFTGPVAPGNVDCETDRTHGMVRTEVTCRRCRAHLGHVFDDGPRPAGQRYCINSASLDLRPRAGDGAETPGSEENA